MGSTVTVPPWNTDVLLAVKAPVTPSVVLIVAAPLHVSPVTVAKPEVLTLNLELLVSLNEAPVTAPANIAPPDLYICAVVVAPSLMIRALVSPVFATVSVPVVLVDAN